MSDRISRRVVLRSLVWSAGAVYLSRTSVVAQSQAANTITIGSTVVEIELAEVSANTLRIRLRPLDNQTTIPKGNESLIAEHWPGKTTKLSVPRQLKRFELRHFSISTAATPLTFAIEKVPGHPIQNLKIDTQTGTLSFQLGDGPVLGLGEGGPQFDRRGNIDSMRSGQGGYRLRTFGGRVPIQWLIGTEGWAIFINQPSGTFDLTGKLGVFTPSKSAPLPFDIFVIATNEPVQIMAEFARLTGSSEMPPLWSLGYLQSHRTLRGPEEIMWVAKTFRKKKLPCDALIYLGTDFTPSGWNTHNGEFSWNPANFPEPKKIVDALHDLNFKVVLHTVLEGRKLVGTVNDLCTAAALPSGRTADNRWPDDRQVSCYWPVHKQLYDVGIDGWWPDQGDGLDGPSRLARIRMYFEGSQKLRPNQRVFALHRNGQAGMQRFAAFLWSGDVYSTWETLKNHVPIAVNTGLSGIPYWGTDIDGFVPTREYTGELHVRWFQFGAFCPLFRAHGRTWHLRLPWGWNTGELGISEVSNYTGGAADPDASELHNAEVEPICRKYLELRYRLLPYLYSVVREGCDTGLPIMRAMWLHYDDDHEAVKRGDQFLWGRDILVAPITEKGATSRAVYLPRGSWFDFWTNEKLEGGKEIRKEVDLATMPLFVRSGAIIPFSPIKQYASERVDEPLTITIYPGSNGSFLLYEDDGKTFDYRRGQWMGIQMLWNDKASRLSLSLVKGSRMLPPAQRKFRVRLINRKPQGLNFNGRPVTVHL